jgi:hypothetical protein
MLGCKTVLGIPIEELRPAVFGSSNAAVLGAAWKIKGLSLWRHN